MSEVLRRGFVMRIWLEDPGLDTVRLRSVDISIYFHVASCLLEIAWPQGILKGGAWRAVRSTWD